MRRLRDFAAIREFFGDREIEELQAAVDARREARKETPQDDHPATSEPTDGARTERA